MVTARKIFYIVAALIFTLSVVSIAGLHQPAPVQAASTLTKTPVSVPGPTTVIYEHYNLSVNFGLIWGDIWKGQTFTPTTTHTVNLVRLELEKTGNPGGNVTVSIRATDTDGNPVGNDLASGAVPCSNITNYPAWYNFDLGAGYVLQANTQYAICWRALSADSGSNTILYALDYSGQYTAGSICQSSDGGISWSNQGISTFDASFEEGSKVTADQKDILESTVIKDGSTYKMWYIKAATDDTSRSYLFSLLTPTLINDLKAGNFTTIAAADSTTIKAILTSFAGLTTGQLTTMINGISTNLRYATSSDGITWNDGGLVSFPATAWDQFIACPNVMKDGSTYKMWYTGSTINVTDLQNLLIALNAANLTPTNISVLLGDIVAGNISQLRTDTVNLSLQTSIQDVLTKALTFLADSAPAIGYAESTDGVTWTKNASNPVMVTNTTGAWDSLGVMTPAVIKNGSTYNMWYTGINVNVSLVTNLLGATSVSGMETALLSGVNMAIGYATSPDGKAWTKNSGPVLQKSVATDWDSYCVFAPAVVMNADGTYDMWYTGGKGNLSIFFNFLQHTVSSDNLLFTGVNTAIGHATSPNGTTWVKDTVSNPVLSKGAGSAWDNSGVAFPSVVASGGYDYLWYTGITASPAAALTSFLNGNNVTAGVAAGSGTGMKIGYASAPIPVPPPSGGGGGGGGGYNPPPTTTTTTATTTITTTTTVITTTPSTSTTTTPVTTTTQPPTTTATTAPTVTTTTTTVTPRPASFEGSSLIIDPTTVKSGEPVNINLRITNVGDVSGIDTVVLKINNQIIDSKQVTLGGGENQVVTFTTTAGAAGNYRVDVAGLTGTFTVGKKSVTAQSWFWPVIIGAFALAIIIGGGITLLLKRRV